MTFQYYPETDMLYIELVHRVSTDSTEVSRGIVLDFDEHQQVVGIEIEDASKSIDLSRVEMSALPIVDLIVRERMPLAA